MKRIDAFKWLWDYHAEELRQFIEKTESGVATEFTDFGKWVDKNTKGMSQDEVDGFIDQYYDDLAMVRDTVPNLLRYSQCMVIYGAFEHEAVGICRLLHSDGKTATKPKKNMYLHDVKKYLMSEARFSAARFGIDWKFIDASREVRNAVAHNRGQPRSGSQSTAVKAFAKSRSDIRLDGSGQLIIEAGFCDELLKHAIDGMSILIVEAKKLY